MGNVLTAGFGPVAGAAGFAGAAGAEAVAGGAEDEGAACFNSVLFATAARKRPANSLSLFASPFTISEAVTSR